MQPRFHTNVLTASICLHFALAAMICFTAVPNATTWQVGLGVKKRVGGKDMLYRPANKCYKSQKRPKTVSNTREFRCILGPATTRAPASETPVIAMFAITAYVNFRRRLFSVVLARKLGAYRSRWATGSPVRGFTPMRGG